MFHADTSSMKDCSMKDCVDVFPDGPKKAEVVGGYGLLFVFVFFKNELMLKSSYQVFCF